ncbi:MAG: RagB/SusD family nutrient uptake outer membrane protein [Tannerellaceae bacterium]|jgi:hypothetical protein|nr:RagB/SusD family nutrient uptake outer membrane protein [Tannerellaceae bacterium]
MDLEPTGEYTEDLVFSDASLTQAFVLELYNNIHPGAKEHSLDGLTDDAYFTHNYGQRIVNESVAINEGNVEWYNNDNNPFKWELRYRGIRYANIIINNIDNVPEKVGISKERLKGEAHYMRAHMYHELIRGFGGVPIVTKDFSLNEQVDMQQPRNTIRECVEFMLADLDIAEQTLPESVSGSEVGRVSKYVATGLKARIALHFASQLYADRVVNTLPVNQYDGDRMALYRLAKENAVKVIEESPFELLDCTGGINTERAVKFKAIMTDKTNSEQMFVRSYSTSGGAENRMGLWHGPNGYTNWSGTTPTHDLVMAFEFEDGSISDGMTKPGDWQEGNPYNGRDPRMYATVATDGNEWGRPRSAGAALDPTPLGRLQVGKYEVTDGNVIDLLYQDGQKRRSMWGIDSRNGPIEDWNGSWTGYYEKKLIDTSIDAQYFRQEVPHIYMRLAEMYLIAAEACVELGELEEAAKWMDILRGRVELKDTRTALSVRGVQFNQSDLREFVRRDRRAELAYEQHRYFDVRRWMIASETGNKPITGILVEGILKPGQTQNKPYIHNEEKYNYFYYVQNLSHRENRKWEDKMYFAPIMLDEMRRNPNLVQNPGMSL